MGRREARRVEDRIHLDTPVTVRVYTTRAPSTGDYEGTATTDVEVWSAVEMGRSELAVGRESTVLITPLAFTVRHDSRFDTLDGRRVEVTYGGESARVTKVVRIGRRRFLRLEVSA